MPFLKSNTTGPRASVLLAILMITALLAGCHFEARMGTGDDAKDKQAKSQAAKTKKDGKKADAKDDKKDDGKKADAKDDKKDDGKKADAKDTDAKDEPAKEEPAAAQGSKESVSLPGNLVFEAGKSTLKEGAASEDVLRSLKAYLDLQTRVTLLRLEGHSDNAASPADNLRISGERALTVKKWLTGKGIAESRLVAVGFGEKKPIADNSSEEGRAQNRRVEFKIAKINDKPYLGNDPLGGGTEFK